MTAPFLVEFLSFITPSVLTVSISGNWATLGVDQPHYYVLIPMWKYREWPTMTANLQAVLFQIDCIRR